MPEELWRMIRQLQARVNQLESQVAGQAEPQRPSLSVRKVSRGGLLKATAAGAAGLAGAALLPRAATVEAANPPLYLNQVNTPSSSTYLDASGVNANIDGLGVAGGGTGAGLVGTGGPDGGSGVYGAGGNGNGHGVEGHAGNGTVAGVYGTNPNGTGVWAESYYGWGLYATSSTNTAVWANGSVYGGAFFGSLAPIRLGATGVVGAPTTGKHYKGEISVDANGVFWVCVIGDGTDVGAWKSLSSVVPIPNVRVLNTRPSHQIGPYKGPIANNTVLTLTLAGTNGIPSNATGVMGNLTAADATGSCFLALVPSGANHVGVSSINFPAQAQGTGLANAFTVGLSSDGKVDIYTGSCSSYTVNIIMDITGFIV
jgi:hypothetical protein